MAKLTELSFEQMEQRLIVGLGGFFGAILRYWVSGWIHLLPFWYSRGKLYWQSATGTGHVCLRISRPF